MSEHNGNGTPPRMLADAVEIHTPETDRLIAVSAVHLEHLRRARYEISEGQKAGDYLQEQNAKTNLANAPIVKEYLVHTDMSADPEAVYNQVESAHTRIYTPDRVKWVLRNAASPNGSPSNGKA